MTNLNKKQQEGRRKQDRAAILVQSVRAALRGEPIPLDLCEADKETVADEVAAIRSLRSPGEVNERLRQLGEKVTGVAPMAEKAVPKW